MGNTIWIPTSADPITDISTSPVAPTTDVSALIISTTDVGTPAAPTTDIRAISNNTVHKSLSRNEEYTACVGFFTQADLYHEYLPDKVAISWEYFIENNLWDTKFPTLLAFEESFGHSAQLKRIVENSSRTRQKTNKEVKKLESIWGPLSELPLQPLLPPEGISYHLSCSLSKLAESVPLNDVIGPLRQAVEARRNGPRIRGKELGTHITNRDVEMVLQEQTTRTMAVRSSQRETVEVSVCTLISADTH